MFAGDLQRRRRACGNAPDGSPRAQPLRDQAGGRDERQRERERGEPRDEVEYEVVASRDHRRDDGARIEERKRAHVAYRYVLEEGLRYQELLAGADPEVQRTSAPLTVEALAVLVNERLAREGELGRVSIEDVRGAVVYGTHALVDTLAVDGERVTVEMRSAERRPAR